jgi:hypothetical protein
MNRDDIKEFLEFAAGLKKSSRMLAEAEAEEEDTGEEEEDASEEEDTSEEDTEEEEEVDVSKEEELELSKSLDNSLNALFVDIEATALKSAKVQEESYSLKKMLLAEVDIDIDLEVFASETARIIKNSDVLLDIDDIIMSKARDYLLSKYDEETEIKFLDIMRTRFDVDDRTEQEKDDVKQEIPAPIAVGASGDGGGGGA